MDPAPQRRDSQGLVEGILYCNTGDWVESCTALVEGVDGTLALLSMVPATRAAMAARVALT